MPVEARGGGAWLEQELQTVVLRIEFWSSVSDCTIRAEKSLQLFLKTFEVDIRSFNKCFFNMWLRLKNTKICLNFTVKPWVVKK